MGKNYYFIGLLLLLSMHFLFVSDFYLFEMYDEDCKAVCDTKYHGCIVMNAFGFVFFWSSFLAFFCCSIVTLFFF